MSIFSKFASVGSATMASRILGFAREAMIAGLLGTGPVADAFYAAFRFPNLFRRILAEGAFNIGSAGFSGNQWPPGEAPENAINGIGQKYLNFAKEGSAFLVNSGPSVVSALKFWAANDAVPRDPASYEIWGTNDSIDTSAGFLEIADFTAISVGDIHLPDSRNGGGDNALDDANSFTVGFDNGDAYSSYLVVFPTLKDSASANSMQIADVQAYGQVVPEPATGSLVMLAGLFGLCFRRRR